MHMHTFTCGKQHIALVVPADTFLALCFNATHDAGSLEPTPQYTLRYHRICVCSLIACTSVFTRILSAVASSISRWSCYLTHSLTCFSMLLMMLGRLEPMLQYTLCYDSICVCSSAADVFRTSAVCGTSARDSHSKPLLCVQVLLAFLGAWYLCGALSQEPDQLDRIKHRTAAHLQRLLKVGHSVRPVVKSP